jgi:predicted Kef-type K+ transport protein
MLEMAVIYLVAAIIAVPVAKRLGLGSVLGYLLAGILISPNLLGLVGDQTSVMHFAEFGVVMMLFLVGLELQPARLWKLRHSILGFIFDRHRFTNLNGKRLDQTRCRAKCFFGITFSRYCCDPYSCDCTFTCL